MLGGFGGSSKATNINGRLTNLCLTGGIDCFDGYTPDLKVAGGAKIKKTLCVDGLSMLKKLIVTANANIKGYTTMNYLTVMSNAAVCGDLYVKGDLLVDNLNAYAIQGNTLNIMNDAVLCSDLHVKGDILVEGSSTLDSLNANVILGNNLNIMNDAVVCGDLYVKGDFLVDGSFMFDTLIANVIMGNTLNIMNDAVVCGDLHVKGNILVDGPNNNFNGNVNVAKKITTNNLSVIYDTQLLGKLNLYGNIDMHCGVIANVMALHVHDLYGKSPIEVHDTFHMLNTLVGGQITFESGIEIGNISTYTFDQTSISIGKNAAAGHKCVAIGEQSGNVSATGTNNTFIGHGSKPSLNSVSNEITLGNSAVNVVRSYGAWTFLSDRRDKKDITTIQAGIDFVSKLNPVDFIWNMRDGGKIDIPDNGFIAQDIQAIQKETGISVPGLVYESNPEKLEISTIKLIPILVKALQECHEEILQLKLKMF